MADILLSKPTSNKTILHMREYLGPAVARVVGDQSTLNKALAVETTNKQQQQQQQLKQQRRRQRRKEQDDSASTRKRQPFFQESVPTLRPTADLTAKRPPRCCFGYVCVSGSSRDYAPKSANVAADRMFFIENFCGTNEQTLFGCVEGHGIQGAAVARFLTLIIPDVFSAIARDTIAGGKARKPNIYNNNNADDDDSFTAGIKAADSLPFPLLTIKPRETLKGKDHGKGTSSSSSSTLAPNAAAKLSPTDLLLATAKAIVSNTASGKAAAAAEAVEKREQRRLAKQAAETGAKFTMGVASSSSSAVGGVPTALSRVQSRISEILKDSFKEANAQLNELSSPDNPDGGIGAGEAGSTIKIDSTASGASMIVCLVRGRTLYVSSVGCCRAVLGKLAPSHAIEAAAESAEADAAKHLVRTTAFHKASDDNDDEPNFMSDTNHNVHNGRTKKEEDVAPPHMTPAEALAIASSGSKFANVTASNRLARLNLGISALDTSRVFHSEGSTKGIMSAAQRALIASSHATDEQTSGQKSFSFLTQPFGGLTARELAEAEDKLLHDTHSIPHFPDLPHIIESVLRDPHSTYGKPSRILMEKRRALLLAMKSSTGGGGISNTNELSTSILSSSIPQQQRPLLPPSIRPIISGSKDPSVLVREAEQQDLYEVEQKLRQATFIRSGKLGIPPAELSKSKQLVNNGTNSSSSYEPSIDFTAVPKSWEKEGLGKAVARRFAEARALEEATSGLLNGTMGLPSTRATAHLASTNNQQQSTLSLPAVASGTSALLMSDARYYNEKGLPVEVPVAIALSRDHRPDRPDECLRIYQKGGRVEVGMLNNGEPTRVARVYGQTLDGPGLHTSRCLGFTSGRSLGITTEADVAVRAIEPEDRFVIVASDGLWSVVSSDEAVQSVSRSCSSVLWGGSAAAGYEGDEGRCYFQGSEKYNEKAEEALEGDHSLFDTESRQKYEPGSSTSFDFARQAIIDRPSLSSKRDLPYIEHPAPQVHLSPSPSTELRVSVCAGAAPSAGCGGWGGNGARRINKKEGEGGKEEEEEEEEVEEDNSTSDMPLDLLESVTPALYRNRIRDRIRRVALSAAEALVALARSRWKRATTGSSDPSTGGPGLHDDIAVMVVIFDQLPPPPKV